MKTIIGLTLAIMALSACTPEEAFIGGTLAGIVVSDASDQRDQRQRQRFDRRSTDVFIETRRYDNYPRARRNGYYPRAHPRRGYLYGNNFCYNRFSNYYGYYRPRYC
jgi:hypothetical protein